MHAETFPCTVGRPVLSLCVLSLCTHFEGAKRLLSWVILVLVVEDLVFVNVTVLKVFTTA